MYDYEEEKAEVFSESGQRMFLSIRDKAHRLTKLAGVVRLENLIQGESGSSWTMMACVDRLVELGELVEIKTVQQFAGQHRIFAERR